MTVLRDYSFSHQTGSRTIVHTNKDLPELTPSDFSSRLVPTLSSDLDWLHFEGRNVENVREMIAMARRAAPGLRISVEVEKVGARGKNHETLVPLGDVVVVSKDVARAAGAKDKEEALKVFGPRLRPGKEL